MNTNISEPLWFSGSVGSIIWKYYIIKFIDCYIKTVAIRDKLLLTTSNIWDDNETYASDNFYVAICYWSEGGSVRLVSYFFDLYYHGFLIYCTLTAIFTWKILLNRIIKTKDHTSIMGSEYITKLINPWWPFMKGIEEKYRTELHTNSFLID